MALIRRTELDFCGRNQRFLGLNPPKIACFCLGKQRTRAKNNSRRKAKQRVENKSTRKSMGRAESVGEMDGTRKRGGVGDSREC